MELTFTPGKRFDWLSDSVDSLFNDDTVTVMTLSDFL